MNGRAWGFVVVSTTLVLILASLVALGSTIRIFPEPAALSAEAAATMLALAGVAALGIERIIETFWTMVGQATANKRWPLNKVGNEISEFVSEMNEELKPFLQKAQNEIDTAGNVTGAAIEQLQAAKETCDDIKGRISELEALAPENPRARAAVAAASQGIGYLEGKYPELAAQARRFDRAVTQADEFLGEFNDNPARRLISIMVGAFLGLLVAGILGLDVVAATLGENPWGTGSDQPWWDKLLPNLGAAITGLVMGLGASPTHELVKTLQETKKYRKAENNAS